MVERVGDLEMALPIVRSGAYLIANVEQVILETIKM